MGFWGRLFGSGGSGGSTAGRPAREAEKRIANAATERADLMFRMKDVLEKAKTVVAGDNSPDWCAFTGDLGELGNKPALFVQSHPQDHSFALISCFLTSVGLAAQAFDRRSVEHIMPRDADAEGRLTITTLSLMAEHPGCLDEIRLLAPAGARSGLELRSDEVAHVMNVYETLWKAFVSDRNLVCPLDVGGTAGSVRAYLTSRGRW